MLEEVYNNETRFIELKSKSKIDTVKRLLISGRFLRELRKYLKVAKVLELIDLALGLAFRYCCLKKEPIKENRVVFYTFQGEYTCNSKYIAEKLLELFPEFEIIFIVNKKQMSADLQNDIPSEIKFVEKDSPEAYYALTTAHFWFDNALCCIWRKIPKRKGQIYINTWHGSLGIKRLDGNKRWKQIAKYGNKQIDYFLTNSIFDEEVFTGSFWPDVKHLKVGHPRNDIFFDIKKLEKLKKKVYSFYEIEEDTKTVLYAPTFREDKKDVSAIILDYENLYTALKKRFGGNWKILVRPHFHNLKAFKLNINDNMKNFIIDASSYNDMQELMAAMDIGITDYSSWIFDYIFTGRPAFIYARDIEKYVNSRGFYYSLTETPFTIANDDKSLYENIMNYSEDAYAAQVETFLEEKGCYEQGTASTSVVEFMVNCNKGRGAES